MSTSVKAQVHLPIACFSAVVPFVKVQYAGLHNFEDREEEFRADVVTLRRRFTADGMTFTVVLKICCSA